VFTFDYVADIDVSQSEIFTKIAQPVADSCLMGYNGSIFAYGQTGSGKTFTIQGPTIKIGADEAIVSSQNSTGEQFEMRGLM
jgi:kinesin family member 15